MSGLFLTIEGLDGSGKSTLVQSLAPLLPGEVLCLREPGGTIFADQVGSFVRGGGDIKSPPTTPRALRLFSNWQDEGSSLDPEGELLIFNAARADLVDQVIAPALIEGKTVLLDRFTDSTIAYQGYGRGLPLDHVIDLCRDASGGLVPDYTFYLEVSPEERLLRLGTRHLDRIEAAGEDFFARVARGFEELVRLDDQRWFCIDGSKSPDQVAGEALAHLKFATRPGSAPYN